MLVVSKTDRVSGDEISYLRAHIPENEEYGISSIVFHSRRPLHPQRFWDLIVGPAFEGVIRSKGFFWLATRPDWAAIWSSAGVVSGLEPGGLWLARCRLRVVV